VRVWSAAQAIKNFSCQASSNTKIDHKLPCKITQREKLQVQRGDEEKKYLIKIFKKNWKLQWKLFWWSFPFDDRC